MTVSSVVVIVVVLKMSERSSKDLYVQILQMNDRNTNKAFHSRDCATAFWQPETVFQQEF